MVSRRLVDAARHGISQHGVSLTYIQGDRSSPPFCYSAGLARFDHPEIIVFGFSPGDCQDLLNNLAFRVRDGVQRFAAPSVIRDFGAGYPVALIEVTDSSRHLTVSNLMFRAAGAPPIDAIQLLGPDRERNWPWIVPSKSTVLLGDPPDLDSATLIDLIDHEPAVWDGPGGA